MPTTATKQGISLPTYGDPPAIPADLLSLWENTISRAIPRYASTAQRDTEWPSPTAGQFAFTTDTMTLWAYTTAWAKVWSAADNQGWVNITYPTNFTQVGGFVGQSKLTRDGTFLRARISRSTTATGVVTWGNMPMSSHWPGGIWEIGGLWEPVSSTHVRAYVDTDGGIKTTGTTTGLTQLYVTTFFPRD